MYLHAKLCAVNKVRCDFVPIFSLENENRQIKQKPNEPFNEPLDCPVNNSDNLICGRVVYYRINHSVLDKRSLENHWINFVSNFELIFRFSIIVC